VKIQIISNLVERKGLWRDAMILEEDLRDLGHEVWSCHFKVPEYGKQADVNLFLERIIPDFFPCAPKQWVVPNPEWWYADYASFPIDRVLCKTEHARELIEPLFLRNGNKPPEFVHLGFRCRDMRDVNVQRYKRFLHVAGGSQVKNTLSLIDAWREHKIPYPLEIISLAFYEVTVPENVMVTPRLTEPLLKRWMNECWFHIMPSEYEGYGHALHESISCGAVVISINAKPFREFAGVQFFARAEVKGHYNASPMYHARGDSLADIAHKAWGYSGSKLAMVGMSARSAWEMETVSFRERLREIFK
jgi:hypothetical protein